MADRPLAPRPVCGGRRPLAWLVALSGCLMTAGCGSAGPGDAPADGKATPAASALEQAARNAGLIDDAAGLSPVGLYRRRHEAGLDSLCLVPRKATPEKASPDAEGAAPDADDADGSLRFGVDAAFGENVHCRGHGTARLSGDRLILNFARSACLIVARYDGDRVALPGSLDVACRGLCDARGSLEGVSFPRVSREAAVATDARGHDGTALCSD